ncbi:MAG: ATP-binding protein [Gemmatimonadaceae bacterium]
MGVDLRGKRALVVEDSPTQAMALAVLLERAGMSAEMARSAEEAVGTIGHDKFDVVISDVVMPGITGYELCRHLKASELTRDTPFVLLTSLGDPLEIMRALACGADNFVTKPYDAEVLLARVSRVIEAREDRKWRGRTGTIDVTVLGTHFQISSEKEQILDLLVSNFEELVRSNAALRVAQTEAETARRRAEDANKAKSEFLAMMSHDLRTPLNAIGGYSELLAMGVRGEVNEAQQQDLARIRRNQKHLLALVNDVLSFAKVEQGDIALRLATVKLHDTVRPLGAMIEPQVMSRNLKYRFECMDSSVLVRVDRERLEQIVVNLLGNATKFTPPGGEVVMRSGRNDFGGYVSVTDTGIGIPPDKIDSIFEPFVQIDQSNAGQREGVGLGLAISQKLARLMGGTIGVTSDFGHGSAFTISLPLAPLPAADPTM